MCSCVPARKTARLRFLTSRAYWGFGENSTTGNIVSVDTTASPEHGTNPRAAIDKVLDRERASWLGGNMPGRLTLILIVQPDMSDLTIWADSFPKQLARLLSCQMERTPAPTPREIGRVGNECT